ncbi:MAG: sigma-70 family RNA polymerase sigma factor [Acetatifactor sp.]|nr:sigma-70 family RNA polymerase sigma factor [Acetatifactor sp.]
MEDSKIIELYWQRDEAAITETAQKYGAFCHAIAMNLLQIKEDAEECLNDTYHTAWNSIPPQKPEKFRAWLGRVVRNLSLALWNKNHRQKRYSGMTALLDELEDCIPSSETVEQILETKELSAVIDRWLMGLSGEDRALFVRRYWNGTPLNELASLWGISPNKLAQKMFRLRLSLRLALEKEGITL